MIPKSLENKGKELEIKGRELNTLEYFEESWWPEETCSPLNLIEKTNN